MPRDLEDVLRDDWGGARVYGVEPAPTDGDRHFRIRPTLALGRPRPDGHGIVRPTIRCLNVYDLPSARRTPTRSWAAPRSSSTAARATRSSG